jgi:Cu-Zn family superoxide dismutase
MKPVLIALATAALLVGCATNENEGGQTAVAQLNPTKGNNVTGTVTFTKVKDGVRVVADVNGLTPGPHGFHIHEKGDCSAPDASSAGGHFNPTAMPHGAPEASMRHVGDFGNLVADASGKARLERIDQHLTFQGPNSIIGRAMIVHEKRDDLKTQPSGDAGPRVACGVIQLK